MMILDSYKNIKTEIFEKSKIKLNQKTNLFKDLIIPFSTFSKKDEPLEIYSGKEVLSFEEKDPLFKSILRKEFSDAIKDFYKKLVKIENF